MRRDETQEEYARGLGLTQTQISKLELGRMPQMSAAVHMALRERFGGRLLGGQEEDQGTGNAPPSEELQGAPGWREAMREDQTYREAWPKVHRLWLMSRKPKSRGNSNWSHLVAQIDMLLRDAEAEEGSQRKRRKRG